MYLSTKYFWNTTRFDVPKFISMRKIDQRWQIMITKMSSTGCLQSDIVAYISQSSSIFVHIVRLLYYNNNIDNIGKPRKLIFFCFCTI